MLSLTISLKFFVREMVCHYVRWFLSAEVFEYHSKIKNKKKLLSFVLTATPQCLEIYCDWRESGHFSLLGPSLKAQTSAQQKPVLDWNFKEWIGHLFLFNRKTLCNTQRTSLKLIDPIWCHNPAARLTDTRTIRPRKRNTFAQAGVLKHPLLLLQEHFIPDFRQSDKQRKMKERQKSFLKVSSEVVGRDVNQLPRSCSLL